LLDVSGRSQACRSYIGVNRKLVPLEELTWCGALRSGRQGGGHARRDRSDPDGVRARDSIVDITAKLLSNALSRD